MCLPLDHLNVLSLFVLLLLRYNVFSNGLSLSLTSLCLLSFSCHHFLLIFHLLCFCSDLFLPLELLSSLSRNISLLNPPLHPFLLLNMRYEIMVTTFISVDAWFWGRLVALNTHRWLLLHHDALIRRCWTSTAASRCPMTLSLLSTLTTPTTWPRSCAALKTWSTLKTNYR